MMRLAKSGICYPVNFTTNALNPASTVEYYGSSVPQTVQAATYGNIILTNPVTSTTSVKSLNGNTSIVGNATVNAYATCDLGTYTANRSASGGTFTANANGIILLSGDAGGQTGSNFPTNFSSMTLFPTSTINYNGAPAITQTVFTGVVYGNLTLSNNTGAGSATKILASSTTGISGSLTVNNNTIFDLVTFSANRSAGSGTLVLSSGATMKLGGTSGGQTGSNFPSGFTIFTLDAASTTQYDAPNGTAQTIFATPTYGNLVLSNKTGTANATKSLTADMTGIAGDLSIGTYATFDQLTRTANRTTAGGTLTIATNGQHRISGTTGGACSGSNYPNNFSTFAIDANGTTEYYGGAQQICNLPVYGHLVLSSAGIKTASASTIHIKGNLVNNSPGTFAHNSGTISLEGTGAQSFAALAYNNISFINGNTKSMTGATSVQKELLIGASTTLALGNSDMTLLSSASGTANVAEIPATGAITYGTGLFSVQRYINTGTTGGQHIKSWQMLASPTNGQTIKQSWMENGLSTTIANGFGTWISGPTGVAGGFDVASSTPSMKYYDQSADSWITVSNPSTTQINYKPGYMIFVRGDRSVFNFSGANSTATTTNLRTKGTLNVGTQALINIAANKFYLAGNPYASPLDFSKVTRTGGMDDAFYVWDPTLNGALGLGGYQTIRKIGGVYRATPGNAPGSGSTMYNTSSDYRNIQSGSAFFVHATGSAGTVQFKEDQKGLSSSVIMVNRFANTDAPAAMISASLLSVTSTGNWLADGNRILFEENSIVDVDGDDILKIGNTSENFGIIRNSKSLTIESHPPVVVTDTVYYNMNNMKQQGYQLMFVPENMPSTLVGTLVDKFTGTRSIVSMTDTTYFNVTITADALSKAADRFMLVFNKIAGTLPVTITSVSAVRSTDRSVTVNWKVENEINMEKYEVERSADGARFTRILATPSTNSRNYAKMDVSPLSEDNFYRIKATSISGQVQYSAIVKVAAVKTAGLISVYPNPVEGKVINLRFTDMAQGTYQLQLTNKLGQVLYTGSASVTASGFVKNINIAKQVPAGSYQLKVVDENGRSMDMQVMLQ